MWEGLRGIDVNPKPEGPRRQVYLEHIDLQPIDPQANGPQLLYGLRYHTLTIPRGQAALATGKAARTATSFEVVARRGSTENGICSGWFLEQVFTTTEFRLKVTINPDGNTLTKVGEPVPNPLARIK